MVWFLSLLLTSSTLALSQRGPRTSVIVLWILSSAAGLLTHYYFVFELVVSVAWLFCHSSGLSRSQLAFRIACAGSTVLPWYLHVPESLGRWRVTQSWLSHPLTAADMFANPVRLAWSYVSVTGLWGGSRRGNIVALAVYGGLAALIVRERAGKVSSGDRRFLWFLVLASVLGPVVFDVLRHTNSSSIARYALPGLPAALLLIAIGTSVLPTKIQAAALIALTIVWLPGLRHVFAEPSRPFEPFPLAASQVAANVDDSQVVIVHSIPSGVIAVARYLAPAAPMVSWVVQLRQRDTDDDMERLTSGYRNVALIKIHDLGESSPAEDWLLHNATHKSTFALAAFPKSEIRDFEMRSE